MTVDYRELLKKYMTIVHAEEGTTFVDMATVPQFITGEVAVSLSNEEYFALTEIEKELTAADRR